MKDRQIKKNSKTAVRYMVRLNRYHPSDFAKADIFDAAHHNIPPNTMLLWFQTSYWENEWESQPAYFALHEIVWWNFVDIDFSGEQEVWNFTPDLSSTKKLFDYAKKMIEESVGGGV